MALSKTIKTMLSFVIAIGALTAVGIIAYDVLFSKPKVMTGVVVDKLYVPAKHAAGPSVSPYSRYKSYDYTISTEKHHQWIAFVKIEGGTILKVNCHSDHYETKQVGDTLHFKEYTGDLLGIDYFSHNEEDEEKENIKP
jgi:hypothetical protein